MLQFLDFSIARVPHVWAFQRTEQRPFFDQLFPDYRTEKLISAREGIGPVCIKVYYSQTIRTFHNHFSGLHVAIYRGTSENARVGSPAEDAP